MTIVDFRKLVAGQKFRKLDPFGYAGPVRTFVRAQQARARGYWIVTVEERVEGSSDRTVSFQTGDKVEIVE